ncbi:putative F420-dependent oxidoreductase [Zhongshania antarctica]|uniref:Putative F420-dependent oxidoreductase n=1 Tax=Zhongshania antarctica TaxID=641702 RepID=A0A840R1Q6_9GAMM|nr:TIGR03619 family F420-dependent LLM class oxidoreductase [Zhongshania antarctica]MBB5186486.1 putative F420-dependent oxidoreductase [Zhongshania antarctica]
MHLGFSSMNTVNDPNPAELAKTLEDAGFESLWYGEHSHIPRCRSTAYPAGGALPEPYKEMMDPYISLMAAAAATSTLKLGTGIALLMERELFSQAKTIATLDRLSGGRVLIGSGVGWNQEEFENVSHQPWQRRYSVLKETVAATRALFADEAPEFHGEFIDFDPVWFEPKPLRSPPMIFGAMGPLGMRHTAEWADGWMPVDVALPDVKAAIKAFHDLLAEFGRKPNEAEITLVVMSEVTPDLLKYYRDCGVDRCNIGVGMQNWDKPEIVMPMIERFSKIIAQL